MIGATLLAMFLGGSLVVGSDQWNEVAREAISRNGDTSWMKAGEARAMELDNTDASEIDLAMRTDGWDAAPKSNKGLSTSWFEWFIDIFVGLGSLIRRGAQLIVLTILLLFIVALFYIAYRTRGDWSPAGLAESSDEDASEAETNERLERLPVQLKRPPTNLLEEAKRLMDAGRFNEAIVYLFSHELVQLDRFQFVRLSRGKTNRQYLRELRGHSDLAEILGNTILVFEDAFFGNHHISESRFTACWTQLTQFHQLIASSLGAAK